MSIEVIDLVDLAHKEKRRKNVFNTPRFHAWMHYYKPATRTRCTATMLTKPFMSWMENAPCVFPTAAKLC